MTPDHDENARSETGRWPARPWLLAALLGAAGLLIHLVTDGNGPDTKDGWRAAVAALLFFGAAAFAFTVERDRWRDPLAFALLAGAVMAGLAWRAVGAGDSIADPEYGFLAGLVATGIALPLFQAGFHRTRFATPYPRIHRFVWDDAICAAGSLAFLGLSWLLLFLLSELFHLLKIDILRDLAREGWFGAAFSGAALGAALGTLRNEIGIIGTLRNVVMVVLSILAVPLAAGLALFLAAMIVSGPDVLWQATRSATPVLLTSAAGAWVLANAILRADDTETSGNRALAVAARVLALGVLPLTVFAAISMGTRVAQHGLSPERLWGLVAIAVATAYGLAWFVAVVRGWRGEWRGNLRQANVHLAVAISAVALLLSLPILDFGAISARHQVARLEGGAVAPEDFDYAALRWDFGDAGRQALARLTEQGGKTGELATLALRQSERVWSRGSGENRTFRDAGDIAVRVQPDDPEVRAMVVEYLRANSFLCQTPCIALDVGKGKEAGDRVFAIVQNGRYQLVGLPSGVLEPRTEVAPAGTKEFGLDSKVEVAPVERRYIVVDGRPIGPPLEDARD